MIGKEIRLSKINNQETGRICIVPMDHAARVTQELGADIVKIACPERVEELGEIVDRLQIPVIVSGGAKMMDLRFLLYVEKVIEAGASGVSAGLNIFQSENPCQLVKCLSGIVHGKMTFEEAEKTMKGEQYDESADCKFVLSESKR